MQQKTHITQQMIDSHLAAVLHHGEPRDVFFYLRFVQNPNVPLINARFGNERFPVWAVMGGDHMHVNTAALLKLRPDVNIKNNKGQNPAMKAFEEKHAGLGLMFLRAGTDLNARDKKGVGLLKYIVDLGYPDALQEAIRLGLDVNQTNIEQKTDVDGKVIGRYVSGALAWAIEHENWDILHVLVDNGIDRNRENAAVRQAMKAAESFAYVNPALRNKMGAEKYQQMVEEAKQKSAAFMKVITDGVFPDEYVFEGLSKNTKTFQRRLALLPPESQEKVLMQMGIMRSGDIGGNEEKRRQMIMPINYDEKLIYPKNKSIQTILNSVMLREIKYGDAKDVYMYLKLGADPNAREEIGGKPALFSAVEENRFDVKVAQKREEIIRTAKYNDTEPVFPDNLADAFVQFKDGPYQKVKFLLDFGADPDTIHPIQKMSVLERAYSKGRLGIVQLLKKRGAHATEGLLIYTAQKGEAQDVEDLFQQYTITKADGQKETRVLLSDKQIQKEALEALKIAVERGKPRMINVFQQHGLVPSADSKEGKALRDLARSVDKPMVLSALEGHYSILPELQKPLTLDEKIAQLSAADLKRLTIMAGESEETQAMAQKQTAVADDKIYGKTNVPTTSPDKMNIALGKLGKSTVPTKPQRPQKTSAPEKAGAVRRAISLLRRLGRS